MRWLLLQIIANFILMMTDYILLYIFFFPYSELVVKQSIWNEILYKNDRKKKVYGHRIQHLSISLQRNIDNHWIFIYYQIYGIFYSILFLLFIFMLLRQMISPWSLVRNKLIFYYFICFVVTIPPSRVLLELLSPYNLSNLLISGYKSK